MSPEDVTAAIQRSQTFSGPTLNLELSRGPNGFGFSFISESGQHFVTQVSAPEHCPLLNGDIIKAIDGVNVEQYEHKAVKSLLRNTHMITVQRMGEVVEEL